MNYIQNKNSTHVFTCNFNKSHILFFAVIVTVFLLSSDAVAGTTGTEFKPVHDKILNWVQGYAGKLLAVAAGIGIPVMGRFSTGSWIGGITAGLGVSAGPTLFGSMVGAVI